MKIKERETTTKKQTRDREASRRNGRLLKVPREDF